MAEETKEFRVGVPSASRSDKADKPEPEHEEVHAAVRMIEIEDVMGSET